MTPDRFFSYQPIQEQNNEMFSLPSESSRRVKRTPNELSHNDRHSLYLGDLTPIQRQARSISKPDAATRSFIAAL